MAKNPKPTEVEFEVTDSFGHHHQRWIAGEGAELVLVQPVEFYDNVGDTVFRKTITFRVILRGVK